MTVTSQFKHDSALSRGLGTVTPMPIFVCNIRRSPKFLKQIHLNDIAFSIAQMQADDHHNGAMPPCDTMTVFFTSLTTIL